MSYIFLGNVQLFWVDVQLFLRKYPTFLGNVQLFFAFTVHVLFWTVLKHYIRNVTNYFFIFLLKLSQFVVEANNQGSIGARDLMQTFCSCLICIYPPYCYLLLYEIKIWCVMYLIKIVFRQFWSIIISSTLIYV